MKKKLLALLLSLMMVFALIPAFQAAQAETVTIDIIEVTDFHGALINGSNVYVGARLAGQIRAIQDANPDGTLLIGGGDMFQGTAISNLFYGVPVSQWMDYMNFDVMAVGNHEFDWGLDVFEYDSTKDRTYDILANNIRWLEDGTDREGKPHQAGDARFDGYAVYEKNGVKIAVIGSIGYGIESSIAANMLTEYEKFGNTTTEFRNTVAEMDALGVEYDYIVSMVHHGSAMRTIANLADEGYPIIAAFGGHSHSSSPNEVYTTPGGKKVAVGIAGSSASGYTRASITIDPDTDTATINSCAYTTIVTSGNGDQGAYDLIDAWYNDPAYQDVIGEWVGYSSVTVQRQQAPLNTWTCEAIAWGVDADIAFANSGGLRTNIVPTSGRNATIGNINFGAIMAYMPFDNFIAKVELTYEETLQLFNLIQRSSSYQNLCTGGVYTTIDSTREAGDRVVGLYRADGTPYLPGETITLAIMDFVLNGGDNFNMFIDMKIIRNGQEVSIQEYALETGLTALFPRDAIAGYMRIAKEENGDFKDLSKMVYNSTFASARYSNNVANGEAAKKLLAETMVAANASEVPVGTKWVTQAVYDALQAAYDAWLATPMTTTLNKAAALANANATLTTPIATFEAALQEGAATSVQFQLLTTSDIHGVLYHSTYTVAAQNESRNAGLTRLATRIATRRAAVPNTILIDNGDLIQGTPLTYYYAFYRADAVDPAMLALRSLGYDAWVLGNHEFNYGLTILNKQIEDAQKPATATESQVTVLAANFIKEGTEWDPWVNAYITRTFGGVKVGIIGLTTPNIPTWEPPQNYAGIAFKSFVATFNHYVDKLKYEEGCDVIIAACHSGVESASSGLKDGEYYTWDNQIRALISLTENIDFVTGGHTHSSGNTVVQNKNGKSITVQQVGTGATTLGHAVFTYEYATGNLTVTTGTSAASGATPDPDLKAILQPYEDEVWAQYLAKTIGRASGDFVSSGGMTAPNAFLDLVNRVQYEAVKAQGVDVDMSISAPLNTGSGTLIPEGDIKLGLMFQLYQYENWLYAVEMTAMEIKTWMEFAASKYSVSGGNVTGGGGIYCDSLYGEGVSYDLVIGQPSGSRVKNLKYQGKYMDLEDTSTMYTVVINNYRCTGGGSYVKYLHDAGLTDICYNSGTESSPVWSIKEERLVYSTQYDMEQGEDLGQVRNLLAAYIEREGVIDPIVESNWRVMVNMPAAGPMVSSLGIKAKISWDQIQFAAVIDVDEVAHNLKAGDTFTYGYYAYPKTKLEGLGSPALGTGFTNTKYMGTADGTAIGALTWENSYKTPSVLAAALMEAGYKVYDYDDEAGTLTISIIVNGMGSATMQAADIVFRPFVSVTISTSPLDSYGTHLYNSIQRIRDFHENGIGDGKSMVYTPA